MSEHYGKHPLGSALGVFALALWSVYVLYAALQYFDVLPSVLIGAFFALLACVSLVFNFAYWRSTVLLASAVYLLIYAIQVFLMTLIRPDLPFFSALSFYYSTSWRVAIGAFDEKGFLGGLTHALLEYAMPVLVIALILVIATSMRRERAHWRTD